MRKISYLCQQIEIFTKKCRILLNGHFFCSYLALLERLFHELSELNECNGDFLGQQLKTNLVESQKSKELDEIGAEILVFRNRKNEQKVYIY